jgi:hypothetical protein
MERLAVRPDPAMVYAVTLRTIRDTLATGARRQILVRRAADLRRQLTEWEIRRAHELVGVPL